MRNLSVFIQSSDSYSDIWRIFFYFFKKNFLNLKNKIYLNTQQKSFKFKGLNIHSTKVGKSKFGKHFKNGLDQVKEENIVFFAIDNIIKKKVNYNNFLSSYKFFLNEDLDVLYLIFQKYRKLKKTKNKKISYVIPPTKNCYSMQVAFWKKKTLKKILLDHENPWTLEWYGTKRCNKSNMKIGTINNSKYDIISYDKAGILIKGKYSLNSINFFKKNKFNVNTANRGIHKKKINKYSFENIILRIKIKYWFIKHGLEGSYFK